MTKQQRHTQGPAQGAEIQTVPCSFAAYAVKTALLILVFAAAASCGGGGTDTATITVMTEFPHAPAVGVTSAESSASTLGIDTVSLSVLGPDMEEIRRTFSAPGLDSAGEAVFARIFLFVPVGPDRVFRVVLSDEGGRTVFTGSATSDIEPGHNVVVIPLRPKDCADGLDDDFNGLIDCADVVSCEGQPCDQSDMRKICIEGACELPPEASGPPVPAPPSAGGEENCANGIDDDGDGFTDCQDTWDCAGRLCLDEDETAGSCDPTTSSCVVPETQPTPVPIPSGPPMPTPSPSPTFSPPPPPLG